MQKNEKKTMRASELFKFLAIAVYGFGVSAYIPIILCLEAPAVSALPLISLPIALCIIGFLLCYFVTRAVKPLIPFIAISILIFVFLGGTNMVAIIPLTLASVSLLAYLSKATRALWTVFVAIASYALPLALTGNPIVSLLALIPSAAALVLFYSFEKGAMRVSSVMRISLVIAVIILTVLIGNYALLGGELSIAAVNAKINAFREEVIKGTTDLLYFNYQQINANVFTLPDIEALTTLAVNTTFNYLPAIIIITLFVVSYITHSLFIALAITLDDSREKIQNALTFKVNVVTAVVFIASFLMSAALEYDGYHMYATALCNLYLIFFPALTMVAFGFAGAFLKGERPSCLGYILYVIMFLMLFTRPEIVFPLASFAGALVVIIAAIHERKKEKDGKDV